MLEPTPIPDARDEEPADNRRGEPPIEPAHIPDGPEMPPNQHDVGLDRGPSDATTAEDRPNPFSGELPDDPLAEDAPKAGRPGGSFAP